MDLDVARGRDVISNFNTEPDDTRYQIIVLHSSSGFPFQHHTALTVIPSQISVPFRECTGPSKARAVLFGCNLDLFLSCV